MRDDVRVKGHAMKWQRARMAQSVFDLNGVFCDFIGKNLWVKVGPPEMQIFWAGATTAYVSNLLLQDGGCLWVGKCAVELLPEFADDVPLQPFDEWRAEQVREGR